MELFLSKDRQAIAQKVANYKLREQKILQLEKVHRIKRLDQQLDTEAIWQRLKYIAFGALLGGLATGGVLMGFSSVEQAPQPPKEATALTQ